MGAHSSLCITREKALSLWKEFVINWYDGKPPVYCSMEPCNKVLEHWLDDSLYTKLYNACITPEDEINEYNDGSWLTVNYLLGE